mmetsp:Transcript_14665/g.22708  ORF Transcript_14665/g.22708 Transcript_14665/m.22708 type:complete len:302 (+) Transcript_14665:2-907(+)
MMQDQPYCSSRSLNALTHSSEQDIMEAEMQRALRRLRYTRKLSMTKRLSSDGSGTNTTSGATTSESFIMQNSNKLDENYGGNHNIVRNNTDRTSSSTTLECLSEIKIKPPADAAQCRKNKNVKTASTAARASSRSNVTDASFFVLSLKPNEGDTNHRGYCEGADDDPLGDAAGEYMSDSNSTAESFISDVTTDGYLVKHAKSVKTAKSECGDTTYYQLGFKASLLRKFRKAFLSKKSKRQDGSLDQFLEQEQLKHGIRSNEEVFPEPTFAELFREELRKRIKSQRKAAEEKKSSRRKDRRA